MTDYYAIYREFDKCKIADFYSPYLSHYYDDVDDFDVLPRSFLDDRVLSFAVSLGEIDELQLDALLQMVRDKNPVEICESDWSLAKTKKRTVLIIDESNINKLSPGERIRFNRMLDLYQVAVGDNRFSPTLFEPLYFCVQCRDQIKEKAKQESETRPQTPGSKRTGRGPKGKTVAEKVAELLYKRPEVIWSQKTIAEVLGCSTASVNKSEAWKNYMNARRGEKEIQKRLNDLENSKRRHKEEIDKLDSQLDASD